jgi:hypothetical protein
MAPPRSLSDECLDRVAWRTWVAIKTIVQRERRGGESQWNVAALLTPIVSSLVGGAREHARGPLVEKRIEEGWWQTRESHAELTLA